MGQKLSTASGELKSTPVVNVRGEKNQYFIGTFAGHKQVASSFKNEKTGEARMQDIYEFTLEDTDMELLVKQGTSYTPTKMVVGDTVSIFAPTRLNNALVQATKGMRLQITYLGLGKASKFGGKPHMYDVEVL